MAAGRAPRVADTQAEGLCGAPADELLVVLDTQPLEDLVHEGEVLELRSTEEAFPSSILGSHPSVEYPEPADSPSLPRRCYP